MTRNYTVGALLFPDHKHIKKRHGTDLLVLPLSFWPAFYFCSFIASFLCLSFVFSLARSLPISLSLYLGLFVQTITEKRKNKVTLTLEKKKKRQQQKVPLLSNLTSVNWCAIVWWSTWWYWLCLWAWVCVCACQCSCMPISVRLIKWCDIWISALLLSYSLTLKIAHIGCKYRIICYKHIEHNVHTHTPNPIQSRHVYIHSAAHTSHILREYIWEFGDVGHTNYDSYCVEVFRTNEGRKNTKSRRDERAEASQLGGVR